MVILTASVVVVWMAEKMDASLVDGLVAMSDVRSVVRLEI